MKKALVVFLILAVAGGLFAQVSWSGSVETGIGIGFTDADGDAAPRINFIRNRGENGLRGTLSVSYKAETDNFGTYGAAGGVAMQQAQWGESPTVSASDIYLWWEPNPMLRIRLGNGGDGGFGTPGAMGEGLLRDWRGGLNVGLTPVPGLLLGGHVIIGQNGEKFTDKLAYAFGVKYSLPVSDIIAAAKFATATDPIGLTWAAGANFKGITGLTLGLDAAGYNFADPDKNYIGAGPKVSYSASGLSLSADYQIFLALGKTLPTDFNPMRINGSVSYKVSDVVTLGAEGRFLIGGTTNAGSDGDGWRPAGNAGGVGGNFDKKDAQGFALSPYVTFNVGPTLTIGYNRQQNITSGATGRTTTNLIYAQLTKSF